jgi:hypothetical protein
VRPWKPRNPILLSRDEFSPDLAAAAPRRPRPLRAH